MRSPSVVPALPLLPLAPICFLALTSCAQGMANRSAMEILSTVILAGGPSVSRPTTGSGTESAPTASRVLGTAEEYLGVPYRWGGSSPETGFDCSGYVRYVYGRQGVRLPRTSREQAWAGAPVSARLSSLRQGDLMLFAESKQPISHVAIYAGGGRIIHSSSSGGGVRYDELGTRRGQWFVQHMVAARRLSVDGRSLVQALELLTLQDAPLDPPDHAPSPSPR
jgi:cell wall-associated NlpC family hydrolase